MELKLDNEAMKMLKKLLVMDAEMASAKWDGLTKTEKKELVGEYVALESKFGGYIIEAAKYQRLLEA